MKNVLIKTVCSILSFAFVLCMCSCSGKTESNTDSSSSSQSSTNKNSSENTSHDKNNQDFSLTDLQTFDTTSKDAFAGYWRITAGEGSKLSSFIYMFDGNTKADIIIDNAGYCGKYTLTTDNNSNNQKTFVCQLMFGINGIYTYKFSNSNTKVVLTNTSTNKTTTLEKVMDFDCIPIPDKSPVIDDDILGAWKNENGEYFYFDKGGVMYHNQQDTMFTFSKYNAEKGVITSKYKMQTEATDTYDYSLDKGKLLIDGVEFTSISPDKLS